MWLTTGIRGAYLRGLSTALLVATTAASAPLAADDSTQGNTMASLDGVTPHIYAVLYDPAVQHRIEAWGLTVADVQHDVDSLSPAERVRLAYVLTRRWRGNETHSTADLQAQFLVTLSLMRESTLFASVIASGPARLLR